MPQKFSTNFMPTTPQSLGGGGGGAKISTQVPSSRGRGGSTGGGFGLLEFLAALLLIAALIISAGVFLFERSQVQRVAQLNNQLQTAEKQFEPELIEELQILDRRLSFSSQLLREHTTLAPFFNFLNSLTLPAVQFDSFLFEFTEEGVGIVQVNGQAQSYQAIAQQSEKFAQEREIDQHIFSDFVLQDTGRVRFGLLVTLADEILKFEESINSQYTNYSEAPQSGAPSPNVIISPGQDREVDQPVEVNVNSGQLPI